MPTITVTWGELFDRIATMELDMERLDEPAQRAAIEVELDILRDMARTGAPGAVHAVASELKDVLRVLRNLESEIDACESDGSDDADLVRLTRSVRRQADRRLDLERSIDRLMAGGMLADDGG